MKNILLFAGTTEGRLLAEFLIHQPVRLHTAVATAYGASLLPSAPSMTVSSHRMNEAQMIDFIQQQQFDLVLDATHPYASEASANISSACTRTADSIHCTILNTTNMLADFLRSSLL